MKKLIIYGAGETAEICADYFQRDSNYRVESFVVERNFITRNEINSIPVNPIELATEMFPPEEYFMFAAASFSKLNEVREHMYLKGKNLGYNFASYISSSAFVWHNVKIGENSFIFENNVLQYNVAIGNNVILWSGNHIGHQTVIEDNCFLSSHVVVSGFCRIGKNSFLGVNTSMNDGITFGSYGFTGSGTVITKNTEKGYIYVGNRATKLKSSFAAFDVKES